MVQPEGSGPKDGRVVLSVNLEVGSLDSDSGELFPLPHVPPSLQAMGDDTPSGCRGEETRDPWGWAEEQR